MITAPETTPEAPEAPDTPNTPDPPETPAVEAVDLTLQYPASGKAAPTRPALDKVNFQIPRGQMFGLLGPNGSGKTTLFRILCTLMKPTGGTLRVFGHDAAGESHKVRALLGVVFQSPSLDPQLTADENLNYHAKLYNLTGPDTRSRIDELLTFFQLTDRRRDRVGVFSGGMKRKLEVAKAILHRPRLLVLDEASTGIDPGARRELTQLLKTLVREQGITVALTTHLMDEADQCDRVAVLSQGQMVSIDTPRALKSGIGGDVILLEPIRNEPGELQALLTKLTEQFGPWPQAGQPRIVDGAVRLEHQSGQSFAVELTRALPDQIARLTVGRPTLEDAYLHLTGQSFYHAPSLAEA